MVPAGHGGRSSPGVAAPARPRSRPATSDSIHCGAVTTSRRAIPQVDGVVAAVCRLAFDYYSIGTETIGHLVTRSRFRDRWNEITVARLVDCLARNPDWLRAWFDYSADKRTSSGWYVTEADWRGASPADGGIVHYEVGDYPDGPAARYDDPVRACAEYVRAEVADIAGIELGAGPSPE
jgi:hypothetical protein